MPMLPFRFIDEMRAFKIICDTGTMGTDAQLLWVHFFLEANAQRWPESLDYSPRKYARRLGLDVRRIRAAVKELVAWRMVIHIGYNQKAQSIRLRTCVPIAKTLQGGPDSYHMRLPGLDEECG